MAALLSLVLLALTTLEKVEAPPAPQGPWLRPPAAALLARIRARGCEPDAAAELIARQPSCGPYREILFYADGPATAVAARCLVRLRDREAVERILALAEAEELGPAGYPAALFGWIVGASYDGKLMPRIRHLLASQDTHTRIFALEAARTLTFLRWRMPEREPRFANPGEVWAMRRWCYRHGGSDPNTWLRLRAKELLLRIDTPAERREVRRFVSRFRRDPSPAERGASRPDPVAAAGP